MAKVWWIGDISFCISPYERSKWQSLPKHLPKQGAKAHKSRIDTSSWRWKIFRILPCICSYFFSKVCSSLCFLHQQFHSLSATDIMLMCRWDSWDFWYLHHLCFITTHDRCSLWFSCIELYPKTSRGLTELFQKVWNISINQLYNCDKTLLITWWDHHHHHLCSYSGLIQTLLLK